MIVYLIYQSQKFREAKDQAIEQVGSYDPMLNEYGEKLVALNFERIQWWLGEGVEITQPAAHVLGRLFCCDHFGMILFLLLMISSFPFRIERFIRFIANCTCYIYEGLAKSQTCGRDSR